MWFFDAFFAAALTSFLPIINKRLLRDTDVPVVAWGFNALSLPILGIAMVLLKPRSQTDETFWFGIVGSGILNMIATLISTQALKLGDASLVTPFLTFNPIFTLLVSTFTLREIPSPNGLTGVTLIVLGSYMFAMGETRAGLLAPVQALLKQRGVVLALGASFVWGVTPIFEKIAIQHSTPENPPLVAFGTIAVMSLLLLPVMLRTHQPARQIAAHRFGFFTAALIAGIAPLFGFTAIALGLVGYVTAIFKLSPVFTVIFAYSLLRETGIRQRLLGSAVMAAGALLLAL